MGLQDMRIRHIAGTTAIAASAAFLAVPAHALPIVGPLAISNVATVTFDGGTAFGAAGSSFASGGGIYGFALTLPSAANFTGGSVSFRLPEVIVTGATGWALSDLHVSLGQLLFSESGAGTTSAALSGVVYSSGQAPALIGAPMDKTVTSSVPLVSSQGFYSSDQAMSAPFTSFRFAGGQLKLTAAAGSAFATGAAPTAAELRFSFTAAAVPEPTTWAMLTAGLLWVVWVARRRPAP